jgi:hypothetical protein
MLVSSVAVREPSQRSMRSEVPVIGPERRHHGKAKAVRGDGSVVVDGMVLELEQWITAKEAYDVRIGHRPEPRHEEGCWVPVACSSRTIAGSYQLRTCSGFRGRPWPAPCRHRR